MHQPTEKTIQVDIVSDVVCPWCVVGFRQLGQALAQTGMRAALRWHPFELNPQMPAEGENLREHLMGKYGISEADSIAARKRLVDLGTELGFAFNFTDASRIVNTFQAHQLLDWAEEHDKQTLLKQALFAAYFSEGQDVSDPETLVQIAGATGLDAEAARRVLDSGERAERVRAHQQFWTQRGVSGVPTMVFAGKHAVSGAQGVDNYRRILTHLADEAA